jgi:hypothetical protein
MEPSGAAVSWEPRVVLPAPDWPTLLFGALIALAILGGYRFLVWLVARRQAATGWKATRYLWPAAMLAAQWATRPPWAPRQDGFNWLMAAVPSVLVCLFWWAVIRVLEWRQDMAGQTTLQLSGPPAR